MHPERLTARFHHPALLYRTFEFFTNAGKELLYRDEHMVVTKNDDRYVIIGWNWHDLRGHKTAPDESYVLSLPSLGEQAIVVKKEVGGTNANPLQTWSNLGKPRSLNREQKELLQASAEPLQTDTRLFAQNGTYEVEVTIPCNHLCMVEIIPVVDKTDTYLGFDPEEFYGLK